MKEKKTSRLEKLRATVEAAMVVMNFPNQVVVPERIDPPQAVCVKEVGGIGVIESQKILKKVQEVTEKMGEAEGFHREQREQDIKRNVDALKVEKKLKSRQLESKNIKNSPMSTKNEMLSQIKKNASDITSKSEQLKKKIETPKKSPSPGKKELVAKKFIESKPTLPTKKDVLSKKDAFKTNKKDMLGDKKMEAFRTNGRDITEKKTLDKKGPDKPKAELKPDKPKP